MTNEPTAMATREGNPLALSFDMGAVDPVRALEKAQQVVTFMTQKCTGPQYISKISDRQYPRVEWWTTAGMGLGLFPVEISNEAVDIDGYRAYLAIYEVRHGGQTVTRASAICARSEEKWANRDEYAIRSMAATRAVGKAYRIGLAGLAVMAGLEPTPAEEIGEPGEQHAPYGICADHGVPYFQSGKMKSPAHKREGGGWCDKPKDRTVEGTTKPVATASAKPASASAAPAPTPREAATTATAIVQSIPAKPNPDAPPVELGPNQKKFRDLAKQRFQQWGEVVAWSRNTLKELMEKSVKDWSESEWERLGVLFEIEREEAMKEPEQAPSVADGTQGQLVEEEGYRRV